MEPSRRRRPTAEFRCFETAEENGPVGDVSFHCSLPNDDDEGLTFGCREPSCGVLIDGERAASARPDDEYAVDPNFFDEGYGLAGKTGFQIWTGSRLMIEALAWPQPSSDCPRLKHWQRRIASGGTNVLELGSGVGVVGTCLAASGGRVLLTDLPTLVENAIRPNLSRNDASDAAAADEAGTAESDDDRPPAWLGPREDCARIGKGWASDAPLDWTRPVASQLPPDRRESIDVIIASDCVFLVSMLNSLLSTVASVFESSKDRSPSFLMSFLRRDAEGGDRSESFTTVNRVLDEIRSRGWNDECLAWRPVTVEGRDSEVFLFEVTPL